MTLLARVRIATRSAHASIEQHVPLLSPHVTLADYAWYLRATLLFQRPVEAALRALGPDFAALVDLPRREKCELLARDLDALARRVAIPTLVGAPRVPRIDGVDRGLGVMYVLEGSTLGGAVLYRHLSAHFDLADASRFLRAYGDERGEMWQRFGRVLAAHEADPGCDGVALLRAAAETFSTFEAWLVHTRDAQ